eukprot:4026067-Prorocentrum_lima.AAC.1
MPRRSRHDRVPSGTSSSAESDWCCQSCGRDNWAVRSECRFCATYHPPEARMERDRKLQAYIRSRASAASSSGPPAK